MQEWEQRASVGRKEDKCGCRKLFYSSGVAEGTHMYLPTISHHTTPHHTEAILLWGARGQLFDFQATIVCNQYVYMKSTASPTQNTHGI